MLQPIYPLNSLLTKYLMIFSFASERHVLVTQLIELTDYFVNNIASGKQINLILLDFR